MPSSSSEFRGADVRRPCGPLESGQALYVHPTRNRVAPWGRFPARVPTRGPGLDHFPIPTERVFPFYLAGLEPATSRSVDVRSIHLSYRTYRDALARSYPGPFGSRYATRRMSFAPVGLLNDFGDPGDLTRGRPPLLRRPWPLGLELGNVYRLTVRRRVD